MHNESKNFKETDIDVIEWIEPVRRAYGKVNLEHPLRVDIRKHDGLEQRLEELGNQKHAIQQASLIGHMDSLGMLAPHRTIVEFGCGRGELSRYVARSMLEIQLRNGRKRLASSQSHLLIDRASQRMKLDSKITKDFEELVGGAVAGQLPAIKRIKIDIKDLNLDGVQELRPAGICVISKHLCGCATDLTLQCLRNSSVELGGAVIALCCRQLCTYETFAPAARDWLAELGFDARGFHALTRMTSWAVCGSRRKPDEPDVAGANGLTEAERHQLGMYARRIIDMARVVALQKDSYEAEIVQYVDASISLENHCLIVLGSRTG
jgi:tRNA:m4X modification enzyme